MTSAEPPVVEEEVQEPPPPPPRGRPPALWPWLLLLLLLVAAGLVALWFFTRDNGHKGASSVVVPNVIGQKQGPAVDRLKRAGLQTASVASSKPNGIVIGESPAAGASVARGSAVTLRVSRGPSRIPNVVGQTRSAAVSVLKAAGFKSVVFVLPSSQPKNTVVAESPHAGAAAPRGSEVRLNISSGIPPAGGGSARSVVPAGETVTIYSAA
jgi:beta-lactam-binding protein with PASTA domain